MIELVQTVLAFAAIATAIATVIVALATRGAVRLQENQLRQGAGSKSNTASAVIAEEYLDRRFLSRPPVKIGRQRVVETRVAKKHALNQHLCLADSTLGDTWSNLAKRRGTWENGLAYELAIALERLGVNVFTGQIEIKTFLALASDQVTEDWPICSPWIDDYRKEQKSYDQGSGVPFHRRHAEWLVLVAALWLHERFPGYKSAENLISQTGGVSAIKAKLKRFTLADMDLIADAVKDELSSLGVDLTKG